MCLDSAEPEPLLSECRDLVRGPIMNVRASTWAQYGSRWKLFSEWCVFVYVAAISSHHDLVDNGRVGSHKLVSLFLRGALRLYPPRVWRAPVWDSPLLVHALYQHPFESLAQAGLKWRSFKAAKGCMPCLSEAHA